MADPWQGFVDDQLVGSGSLVLGAIIGLDGGTLGSSSGFNLNAGEGPAIVAAFNDAGATFNSSITIAGTQYMVIKADQRSVYGKKGATGVCLAKTDASVIIGYYNEQGQPGNAATCVEKLADYCRENGY